MTERETSVSGCRAFLLAGAFLIAHAGYKYYEYSRFEAQPGFRLVWDLSFYVRLYNWGGKWAVVGAVAALAAVCLTASVLLWRKLRSLPRDAPPRVGG